MDRLVSRRSTLKAGAHAAWAVPVVTVASTAPAYAGSGGPVLSLTGVSSSYGTDGVDAERPDRFETRFTLKNTGGAPASNVIVSVLVPGGTHASQPSLTLPAGEFTALPTTGSSGAGWTLRATRTLPLGAGQTCTLGSSGAPVVVSFTEAVTTSPYQRWAGKPFTSSLQASATAASTVAAAPGVAASAPTYFEGSNFSGSRSHEHVSLQCQVTNVGRKTCNGPVTIEIDWEGGAPDGSRWTSMPGSATSPQLGAGTLFGDGSFGNPWGFRFSYASPRATRQSFDDFYDPAADAHCDITFTVDIVLGEPPGYTGRSDSRTMRLLTYAADTRDFPFVMASESISGSD